MAAPARGYNFKKGQPKPPGSGRKKGTANKNKITRVADILAEKGINPAEEILKLIPNLTDDKDKIKAWADLLGYCEAKPKSFEVPVDPDPDLEGAEELTTGDLLSLVQAPKAQA